MRWLFSGHAPRSLLADLGFTLVRAGFGIGMAFGHGIHKLPPPDGFVAGVKEDGFPAPLLFAWAAALAEFAGGLLMAAGLLTRVAGFFVLSTMGVAFFVHHAADPFKAKELAAAYGLVALCFVLAGAGRLSVDALLRGRR